jgi:SAM-dependent methyltransferase
MDSSANQSPIALSRAYAGTELEAMAFAENYHRWILEIFKPLFGKRVVEVGSGSGSFAELLVNDQIETLSLIEPAAEMYKLLNERVGRLSTATRITTYNAIFTEIAEQIKLTQRPDSIVYVNVLEHIADDEAELRAAHHSLAPGGRIFIFVPAFQWLFGEFDKQIGHYRRYTKAELCDKCRRAGFRIVTSEYMDLLGIVPWWIKYRLLGSTTMDPRTLRLWDKYVVPVSRSIESAIKPPAGKNIILVGETV